MTVIGNLTYYQLAPGVGTWDILTLRHPLSSGYGSPPVFSSRSLPVLTNVFLVQNSQDGLSGASLRYVDDPPTLSMSVAPQKCEGCSPQNQSCREPQLQVGMKYRQFLVEKVQKIELNMICRRRLMLKMIFFDEDPDEVLKEEDIRTTTGTRSRQEIERIDFRDTEEVNIDFRILEICDFA